VPLLRRSERHIISSASNPESRARHATLFRGDVRRVPAGVVQHRVLSGAADEPPELSSSSDTPPRGRVLNAGRGHLQPVPVGGGGCASRAAKPFAPAPPSWDIRLYRCGLCIGRQEGEDDSADRGDGVQASCTNAEHRGAGPCAYQQSLGTNWCHSGSRRGKSRIPATSATGRSRVRLPVSALLAPRRCRGGLDDYSISRRSRAARRSAPVRVAGAAPVSCTRRGPRRRSAKWR
jgi:hypothetical protein